MLYLTKSKMLYSIVALFSSISFLISKYILVSQTDIQTSSQRFQLTSSVPRETLTPDESQDEVLSYEVKELGTHM